MKILVLVEDYPSENNHAMMYVHVRNKYYQENGINVTVLSFKAKIDYKFEDINVISLKSYIHSNEDYDILVCHAANLKHHYLFINRYEKRFKRLFFFYHGHEILKINDVYPDEYAWKRKRKSIKILSDIYDTIKLVIWRKTISKLVCKSQLIFVSQWLYHRFLYYVHINPSVLDGHVSIINNSVGKIFEDNDYDYKRKKTYDFITIRGDSLDRSKYGIDIVTKLAKFNSQSKFLVIGRGDFYKHYDQPNNLTFIEKSLTHNEMIAFLNDSRCALLPTKQDTQGVLTCEMATFGIPTITSNIEICREVFKDMDNVELINNENTNIKINDLLEHLEQKLPYIKSNKFIAENTIKNEVELLKNVLE